MKIPFNTLTQKRDGASRRSFLKTVPALSGLMLDAGANGAAVGADEPQKYGGDGIVGFVVNRSEMGQGVRTNLPRIVVDELEADWRHVRVVQAPGDEAKYGN